MDRQVQGSNQTDEQFQGASFPEGTGQQTPPQTLPSANEPQPEQAQGQEPEVDYKSLAEQREREAQAARQRAQQLEQTIGQVQQWAQQAEAQQRQQSQRQMFNQRKQEIIDRAGNMRVEDANRYIASELDNLYSEFDQRLNQTQQQLEQRRMQEIRQIATPLYIDDLVKKNGLPEAAKQELLAYGDPDVARKQVPYLKERYERERKLEEQLRQLSRTQEAQRVQRSGVTQVGGYDQSPQMQIPEGLDADEKAAYILHQLTQR